MARTEHTERTGRVEDGAEDGAEGGGRGRWDDGLIARRADPAGREAPPARGPVLPEAADPDGCRIGDADDSEEALVRVLAAPPARAGARSAAGRPGAGRADRVRVPAPAVGPEGQLLRARLDALRQLVALSRTRLDGRTLAEAGRVLDEAATRGGLSPHHTVVAVAGPTGSGKSTLFNALAGVQISETGLRRPTTAAPLACSWSDGAAGLLDRLEIPGRLRRRPREGADAGALRGLVLVDLPDLDSALGVHREHVDRVLALVDAVVWVVDPEKYADAVLHERYLRPLAGHAEVSFVVLNQVDRLPGDAADQVLDDLRRLLDEDGIAVGEHGDPGATVLGISALTGDGVPELRELLAQFTQEHGAATRRISADVDRAAVRLRPLYVADGHPVPEIGEATRAEFEDRLAEAVGAYAAGLAAERAWRRNANKACGTPWLRMWRWYEERRTPQRLSGLAALAAIGGRGGPGAAEPAEGESEVTARQRVEQAVRLVADEAANGLPDPWSRAVREAAARGAERLPEALDELTAAAQEAEEENERGRGRGRGRGRRRGRGGDAGPATGTGAGTGTGVAGGSGGARAAVRGGPVRPPRPKWWPLAVLTQVSMTLLQVLGGLWLVAQIAGLTEPKLLPPVLVMLVGIVGGPLVEWACAVGARGPARRYGAEAERRLREAAAGAGRARVLEPVAAELLRYREVREQFAAVARFSTSSR
ncbi:GTPase [Streptomyces sp. BI20]|uniref:GTPase n=1 Tax=Streptomyces sp. BI20 TaxID=3403460 RepID=UPI003C744CB6